MPRACASPRSQALGRVQQPVTRQWTTIHSTCPCHDAPRVPSMRGNPKKRPSGVLRTTLVQHSGLDSWHPRVRMRKHNFQNATTAEKYLPRQNQRLVRMSATRTRTKLMMMRRRTIMHHTMNRSGLHVWHSRRTRRKRRTAIAQANTTTTTTAAAVVGLTSVLPAWESAQRDTGLDNEANARQNGELVDRVPRCLRCFAVRWCC